MNIVLAYNVLLPALKYGGTHRVVWGLGKALSEMGHRVHFLVAPGSSSSCYGSECYVHNGLDWNSMPKFSLGQPRKYFHFLGNAAFRRKMAANYIKKYTQVLNGRPLNPSPPPSLTKTVSAKIFAVRVVSGDTVTNVTAATRTATPAGDPHTHHCTFPLARKTSATMR